MKFEVARATNHYFALLYLKIQRFENFEPDNTCRMGVEHIPTQGDILMWRKKGNFYCGLTGWKRQIAEEELFC